MKFLTPGVTANIKNRPTPNQIKINPHIRNHLFQFLLPDTLGIQKHKRHIKMQEKIYNCEEMTQ